MRILIVGGSGMLGHQLFKQLAERHDVRVTLRKRLASYSACGLFDANNSYPQIELSSLEPLTEVVEDFHPEVIVNAAGVLKLEEGAAGVGSMLDINSLLPRRLAQTCGRTGTRLIHMSTDGVFSGKKGGYRESDTADAVDLYGKTKFLGEVCGPGCLTLRTSIIGRELINKASLLEWLLSQRGTVNGFSQVVFSGFTTIELARVVDRAITEFPEASGLYHVSSEPISKKDLLMLLKNKLRLPVDIVADDKLKSDLSLDSTRFRSEFGYNPPTWETMIEELAQEFLEIAK
jgi:dTDP-4-dehydrorhamnose reductase